MPLLNKIYSKRAIYTPEYLAEFCKKNNIICCFVDNNEIKITRDSRVNGKCISENCENSFEIDFRSLNNKKLFYCKDCLRPKSNKKRKETCQKKYGVSHVSQSPEIQLKIEETCQEKYGGKSPASSEDVKLKMKSTTFKNLGVEYSHQSSLVRDKYKETSFKNWGTVHPHQNPIIANKASKNSYRRKEYIFPSGNKIICQGYEPYGLDELIKTGVHENEIITGEYNVPEIWYTDESGVKHRHYVDIFIESQNKCIEVKSTYTAEKKKDNIFLKQQAGKELGYNYEIWIYNRKGKKVEFYE